MQKCHWVVTLATNRRKRVVEHDHRVRPLMVDTAVAPYPVRVRFRDRIVGHSMLLGPPE